MQYTAEIVCYFEHFTYLRAISKISHLIEILNLVTTPDREFNFYTIHADRLLEKSWRSHIRM